MVFGPSLVGFIICKIRDDNLLPSSAKLWCMIAGPDYRAAYRRIEIIKDRDRLFPTQIRELEISTGIRTPPPKWKTISIGETPDTGRNIPAEFRHKLAPIGPWAEPFDGSLMWRLYGPEDNRPTSYPLGHRGHVASDQLVHGCLACIKTWAVNSRIKDLEYQKSASEQELAEYKRLHERVKYGGYPSYYTEIMILEDKIGYTCKEIKRLDTPPSLTVTAPVW